MSFYFLSRVFPFSFLPAGRAQSKTALKSLAVALASASLLHGCSSPQPQAEKTAPEAVKPEQPIVEISAVKQPELLVSIDPELERQKAFENRDWPAYLQFSYDLWQESPPARQAEIEDQAWEALLPLDDMTLQQLDDNSDPRVNAWSHLIQVFRLQGLPFEHALSDLQLFESDAIYRSHLLPKLLSQLPPEEEIRNVAVFLPMQSKFKPVAEQIQNGILKAYYRNENLNRKLRLNFYDSTDITQVSSLYFQAKQEGADVIIGPLRKNAVEQLQGFDDRNIVALNTIDGITSFTQFSLKSSDKIQQLAEGFAQQQYRMLGILNSDEKENALNAALLASVWNQPPQQSLVQVSYSDEKPELRKAFDQLVNASNSIERKNTLRWTIGEKVEFYPRVREDLNAIVVFDSANRLAVINPQKGLYLLKTPVYTATELNQQNLKALKNNHDLKEVELLTQPVTLNPEDLQGTFEAFGWDSLQVAANLPKLKKGACLSNTKTGYLRIVDNQVQQTLVWAKFDDKGQLTPYRLPHIAPQQILEEEMAPQSDAEEALQQRLRDELKSSDMESVSP
ncbi:penicillin-binding protein activator [Thiomicrorhabdus sp. 6S3-12]|uniref:penicillin-binding protein activator n=1 Tax=Thiomicrorhabdus sp. 6S3-12 TaxID=2819681 RepID=UPI001AAD1BF1|nr:penicillin-binding protein activator [Thiomicrorhabdus sp. 6S3-12]MBO1923684.1 penicillin-binding protein activator [Thiomicrorhabdus sp. 6S3-12]